MSSATKRFRVIDGQVKEVTGALLPASTGEAVPIVSDSLGFPEQCLADRQSQLDASGCKGIEFKRDPSCPEFFQVHGSSRGSLDRYTKSRNLVNRTGSLGGGVKLSQYDLDKAKELVSRIQ